MIKTVQDVYESCRIQGNNVFITTEQFDRIIYEEVKRTFANNGGKWKGKPLNGFVFDRDPKDMLEKLRSGVKVNTKKAFQEFFTPYTLADKMASMCEIIDGDEVLEPSCGSGRLLNACIAKYYEKNFHVSAVELNEFWVKDIDTLLENASNVIGYNLSNCDFLSWKTKGDYDVIIANPPFTKNQDVVHVNKMYTHLKSGGRLVSLMSTSWLHRQTGQINTDFRKFLGITNLAVPKRKVAFQDEEKYVSIELLPAGTFKESGTMVETVLLKIIKK